MHRCNCSTRAFEGFIKDFAGISLRQQRAQRFFQQCRGLNTGRPFRQLQTTIPGNSDDAFIPFDLQGSKARREESRTGAKGQDADKREEQALTSKRDDAGDSSEEEWHAEVEIVTQKAPTGELEGKTVDAVSLATLHANQEHPSRTPVPILTLPAISQHIPAPAAPTQQSSATTPSKALNRQLRKVRRLQEGRYRPNAPENADGENEGDDSMADVLKKIDALAGPSLVKKERRVAKGEKKNAKASNTRGNTKSEPAKERKVKEKAATTPVKPERKPKKERWMIEKESLKQKFGEQGWQPRKRLSPDTLEGIRALHASDPTTYPTEMLASHFQITPEAIRRILKSKWQPSAEDTEKRMRRWERRGLRKWEEMAEKGMRPPKRWRALGAGNPNVQRSMEKSGGVCGGKRTHAERKWDAAVAAADRLPMEGSFADRIM